MMNHNIDTLSGITDEMAQNIENIHNLSMSTESTFSDRSTVAAVSADDLSMSGSSSEAEAEGGGEVIICRFCSKPRDVPPSASNVRTRTRRLSVASSVSSFGDEDIYRMVTDIILDRERREQEEGREDEEIEHNAQQTLEMVDRALAVASGAPLYPHRPLRFTECEVCLTSIQLRRRICCDYKICDECMDTYVTLKVSEAKIQIECPNDRCNVLIHCDEVKLRLTEELREKFIKFLVDANSDPCTKTCPGCSIVHNIDPDVLVERRKLKRGLKVKCRQCKLVWCFLCQAPFHEDLSCKQFKKGDEMVRMWAKERHFGQCNAQRCPKCKVFIQKAHGCNHMNCSQCNTDFCYTCGDRYIQVKFLGSHWSRFSAFGCRYTLLPKKPVLRRLVRAANLACRVVGCTLMGGIALAFGAVVVAAGVVILPGYGIVQLKKRHVRKKRHQKILRARTTEVASLFAAAQATSSATNEESELEAPDRHQVEVLVHRPLSQETESDIAQLGATGSAHRCECYINHFTADSETIVGPDLSQLMEEGDGRVVVQSDIKEVPNKGGYSTVVANIVSRVVEGACGSTNDNRSTSPEEDRNQSVDQTEKSETSASKNYVADFENEADKGFPCSTLKITCVSDKQNTEEDTTSKTENRHIKKVTKKEDLNSDSHPKMEEKLPQKSNKMDVEDSASWQDSRRVEDHTYRLCTDSAVPKGLRKVSLEGRVLLTEDSEKALEESKGGKQGIISKETPNGCFGNIFSKRSFSPDESILSVKTSNAGKFSNKKAATWEKIRRNRLDSMPKLSLHDPNLEVSPIIYLGQRSSSVVSASFPGHTEYMSETGTEPAHVVGISPQSMLEEGKLSDPHDLLEAEKDSGFIDTSITSGYPISQNSMITYL